MSTGTCRASLKKIQKLRWWNWSFIFSNWDVHDSIDVFRPISPNLLLSRITLLKRFCLKLDCNCNNRIAIQNSLVRAKFVIKRRGRRQVWWQTVRHITFTNYFTMKREVGKKKKLNINRNVFPFVLRKISRLKAKENAQLI